MNEDCQEFIKSCFELGQELLDKLDKGAQLTKAEKDFLANLDLISDKYIKI